MPVKKTIAENDEHGDEGGKTNKNSNNGNSSKRRRYDGCFPFREITIESSEGRTVSSLKDIDSNKLKAEIKRWAKCVAAYARRVSIRIGSSRSIKSYSSSDRAGSSRRSS